MENSCYTFRRVVNANCNEVRVRSSKVHSILVSRKYEVHIISKNKEYITPIVYKSKLT